jgi:hypothetical protein
LNLPNDLGEISLGVMVPQGTTGNRNPQAAESHLRGTPLQCVPAVASAYGYEKQGRNRSGNTFEGEGFRQLRESEMSGTGLGRKFIGIIPGTGVPGYQVRGYECSERFRCTQCATITGISISTCIGITNTISIARARGDGRFYSICILLRSENRASEYNVKFAFVL